MGYVPPNRFLIRDGDGVDLLRRVYARVDSVDPPGEAETQIIQLDAVDADQFDDLEPEAMKGERIRHIGIAALEILSAGLPRWWRKQVPRLAEEGQWLQITFDQRSDAAWSTRYYRNLFMEPVERPADVQSVSRKLKARLDAAFSLDDVPDATERTIRDAIARASGADFVNVLDVGQGSACGLWHSHSGAQLYFDLGGGVKANVRTFPTPDRPMCFRQRPPVVLSHWDWDHWSSAFRYDAALDCAWIAPRQKLGAVHRAFAYELHQRRRLWIWPSWLAGFRGPQVTVGKCTGSTRNDSGLAMWVHVPQADGSEQAILLPGDTEYSRLPVLPRPMPLHAAVVSHHGANLNSIASCAPHGPGSALVYSYGDGNTFRHPARQARADYRRSGWAPARTFQTVDPAGRRPFDVAIPITSTPAVTGCRMCGPMVVT